MDDAELLVRWRGGDGAAADELLGRHFDAICRFFRSKLGDDVEDLIQATFLACVERHEALEEGKFKAYLFQIARNKLHDHLRSRYRRPAHEDLSAVSLADLGTTPSQHLVRRREEATVVAALHRLPLDQRIALELAYWEDMKGPEIAEVLGIPANTVRSRLSRAREALRRELEALDASPALVVSTLRSIDRALESDEL